MMSKISRSRRKFLKTTSAFASAPLVLPNLISSASPNGKLNHAVIGSDGQGWSDLNNISSHPNVHITAICDVDTSRMAKAAAKFPDARKYQDWRELLEAEGDKIDSVQVAIPDHMHALCNMLADGLVPSNSKAGYLARMMARRTCRMKDDLGLEIGLEEIGAHHLDVNMSGAVDGRNRENILKILSLEV